MKKGELSIHSDALRRQIAYKAKKIRRTIKSLKSLATKLTPVATPAPVLPTHASQLWTGLNLYLGHINAISETSSRVSHCAVMCADRTPNTSSIPQQRKLFTWDLQSALGVTCLQCPMQQLTSYHAMLRCGASHLRSSRQTHL